MDAGNSLRQRTPAAARAVLAAAVLAVSCGAALADDAALAAGARAGRDDARWRRPGPARGTVPDDDELLRRGAVIGEVYVQTDNVFDPEDQGQDRFLYRLANRLHATGDVLLAQPNWWRDQRPR